MTDLVRPSRARAREHVHVHVRAYDEFFEAAYQERVAFQTRLLELAQQNGIECEVRDVEGVGRLWFVPRDWCAIVGCMAAVVR